MTLRVLVGAAVALTATMVLAVPGRAAPAESHCVTPAGDDLNVTFATRDAFVAPFCREVRVGRHWRPVVRVVVADAAILEQLLGDLVSTRYVVDAGTRREREYVVAPQDLIFETGTLPDGTHFVRWMPRLRPLPPGEHVVDEYVTLAADLWDGLGDDPALNLIEAGESRIDSLAFTVRTRRPG